MPLLTTKRLPLSNGGSLSIAEYDEDGVNVRISEPNGIRSTKAYLTWDELSEFHRVSRSMLRKNTKDPGA